MLHWVVLCWIALCWIAFCCVVLCCAVLCCVVLCEVILCCAVLCCAVLCCVGVDLIYWQYWISWVLTSEINCRLSAAGSQADTKLQQHLSALVSQQEVELHAAKLALDRAARQQTLQKQELAEAQAQVAELRQEVAELSR